MGAAAFLWRHHVIVIPVGFENIASPPCATQPSPKSKSRKVLYIGQRAARVAVALAAAARVDVGAEARLGQAHVIELASKQRQVKL